MSLNFASAALVSVPAHSTINNLSTFTNISWSRRGTIGSNDRLWRKHASQNDYELKTGGTGGDLDCRVMQTTEAAQYTSSSNPLSVADKWYCVAVTYDDTADPRMHIYTGDLTTRMTEVATYATSSNGVGTKEADSGEALIIGNAKEADRAWDGDISHFHFEGRVMTLGEINTWWRKPQNLSDTRLLQHLGINGLTNVPDHSGNGNVGSLVGSPTLSDNVPLGPLWGFGLPLGGAGVPPAPDYEQVAYRFRNDDGVLTEAP